MKKKQKILISQIQTKTRTPNLSIVDENDHFRSYRYYLLCLMAFNNSLHTLTGGTQAATTGFLLVLSHPCEDCDSTKQLAQRRPVARKLRPHASPTQKAVLAWRRTPDVAHLMSRRVASPISASHLQKIEFKKTKEQKHIHQGKSRNPSEIWQNTKRNMKRKWKEEETKKKRSSCSRRHRPAPSRHNRERGEGGSGGHFIVFGSSIFLINNENFHFLFSTSLSL